MFISIGLDRLIDNLETLRLSLCAYAAGPHDTCDCKFGVGNAVHGGYGEQTGCPELRQAIQHLISLR